MVSGYPEDKENAIALALDDISVVDSVNYLMRLAEEIAGKTIAQRAESLLALESLPHAFRPVPDAG